jgi:hypothetical protein
MDEKRGSLIGGGQGPPEEAYGRITNPLRFAPLHDFARALLDRLEARHAVRREERPGLDPELERATRLADPSAPSGESPLPGVKPPRVHPVRLTPLDGGAAPLVVVFTAFPGLGIRFGRWHTRFFPSCGCDACAETPEAEAERLDRLVEHVTSGQFREAIVPSAEGDAWLEHQLGMPATGGRRQGGRLRLTRARALELLGGHDRLELLWKPWPAR